MIHEVLLALNGCPGDLFVYNNTTSRLMVSPDLPFLHDSEQAQLNQLLQIAQLYMQLDSYIRVQRYTWIDVVKSRHVGYRPSGMQVPDQQKSEGMKSETQNGVYIQAFCIALNDYLDEYRKSIVLVERKVLDYLDPDTDGGRTPLSFLNVTFSHVRRRKTLNRMTEVI